MDCYNSKNIHQGGGEAGMKQRIWELDALRGLCVLGMILVHLIYDLTEIYGILTWQYPACFRFIKDYGGILFILISGICTAFSRGSFRRGLIVLVCDGICTLVTFVLEKLGFLGYGSVIWFGALHCLGGCMLLWQLLRHLPTWALPVLGLVFVPIGHWLAAVHPVNHRWLVILGATPWWFQSPDYFPLLPFLGYFLLGAFLGRTLYRKGQSLLPRVNANTALLRFFRFCGRQSLLIYLLHQPVLMAVCTLLSLL